MLGRDPRLNQIDGLLASGDCRQWHPDTGGSNITAPRFYCAAAARAIRELDTCSLGTPDTGQDEMDWRKARGLLWEISERNGYELSAMESERLKKRNQRHRQDSRGAGRNRSRPACFMPPSHPWRPTMPKFEIEQYELHAMKYQVEAAKQSRSHRQASCGR